MPQFRKQTSLRAGRDGRRDLEGIQEPDLGGREGHEQHPVGEAGGPAALRARHLLQGQGVVPTAVQAASQTGTNPSAHSLQGKLVQSDERSS